MYKVREALIKYCTCTSYCHYVMQAYEQSNTVGGINGKSNRFSLFYVVVVSYRSSLSVCIRINVTLGNRADGSNFWQKMKICICE